MRNGGYRGVLEVSPAPSGLMAVNALDLESYIRGVVPAEIPATWPAEALKAQALAARTYALATRKPVTGFDQYADTRSQVYRGMSAEKPTSDAAIAATTGEVVTYAANPVVTYFFSTSGGRTENVENSFIGSPAQPWLRSVDDPYDDVSPRHRWGPYRWSGVHREPQARVAREGLVPIDPGDAARGLPAGRRRDDRRHGRVHEDHRPAAALAARPVRHVGLLRPDVDERGPGAEPTAPRRRRPPRRRRTRARRRPAAASRRGRSCRR